MIVGKNRTQVLRALPLVIGLPTAATANAQHGFYAGANVSFLDFAVDGSPSASPSTASFRLGRRFEFLATEIRLGGGLSNSQTSAFGTPVDVKVDQILSLLLKGMIPITREHSPYVIVGRTDAQVTTRIAGFSFVDSFTNEFSYGIGLDWAISRNVSINAEWARLLQGSNYRVDALTLGVDFKF